jgi:hypothetical protein
VLKIVREIDRDHGPLHPRICRRGAPGAGRKICAKTSNRPFGGWKEKLGGPLSGGGQDFRRKNTHLPAKERLFPSANAAICPAAMNPEEYGAYLGNA